MTARELAELKELYSKLLHVQISSINAPNKYQQIYIAGKLFGSIKSRSASSSIVMAVRHPSSEVRAAHIHFYAQHTVIIDEKTCVFLLFYPAWYKPHQQGDMYGKPVSLWEPDCFELSDTYTLLPVQFISSRTVSLTDTCTLSSETILLTCPIVE